MLLLLTSCTSIRPITKIGLIAPFEGLYRESGYTALDGLRQAVNDCGPPGMDVLLLAVDDSGDPTQAQRAAQKLLIDPTVRAVVGPFLLDTVPAVAEVMPAASTNPTQASAPTWFVPMFIDPNVGYATPPTNTWLTTQIDYVADATAATRILLLGLPDTWDAPVETRVPTLRVEELDTALATITPGDVILWLGRPDEGARWYTAIHQADPTMEFWLAAQAGNDIFAAHTQDQRATHWLQWTPSSYNQRPQPADSAIQPTAAIRDLAYHAACAALAGMHEREPITVAWELWAHPLRAPTQ